MRADKKWGCPHCKQTSSRRWNLNTHIIRHHGGMGEPIRLESEYDPKTSRISYRYQQTAFNDSPSSYSKIAANKAAPLGSDWFDPILPLLRKWVEFVDLMKRLLPQQQVAMGDVLPWLAVVSSSNLSTFQKNNNRKSDESLVGFRVQVCNSCLRGNSLEPVYGFVELEALTKTKHTCRENENPNNIREAQEQLLSYLKLYVNIKYGQVTSQQQGAGTQLRLSAREVGGPELILRDLGNKKLPDHKSWIEEEDYLELKIRSSKNSKENQEHWACRLIKEAGLTKIIKINENELSEFISLCKATFGPFRIKMDDERRRYFVVAITL